MAINLQELPPLLPPIIHSGSNKYNILKEHSTKVFSKHFRSDFVLGKYYTSPLRSNDKAPSFNLYIDRVDSDIIMYKDWGGTSGNCIDFIMNLYSLSFKEAMELIEKDIEAYKEESNKPYIIKDSEGNKIDIYPYMDTSRRFTYTETDRWYWERLHKTSLEIVLREGCHSIKEVRIKGNSYLAALLNKPIYYYKYPNYKWKLYAPFNPDKKWLSNLAGNASTAIGGLSTLPGYGKELIITKSDKDRIVLKGLGYSAINTQGESILIDKKIIEDLKERFEKIYLLYDNDFNKKENTGKILGDLHQKEYEINRIVIPEHIKRTDTAELIQQYDKDILIKMINSWKQ